MIVPPFVSGIGLSPSRVDVDFEPFLEKELTIILINSGEYDIDAVLRFSGELARHVKTEEEFTRISAGGSKEIKYKLELPGRVEPPGGHKIEIQALGYPAGAAIGSGSGVIVSSGVTASLVINVPYPDKYLLFDVKVENVNVGEPLKFRIPMQNLGLESISSARFNLRTFDILDENSNVINTLNSEKIGLEPKGAKEITMTLNTRDYKPGVYYAIVAGDYDGRETMEKNVEFRIGTLDVEIVNHTSDFIAGKINKFSLLIRNMWNSRIMGLTAEIKITPAGDLTGQQILKTPAVDIEAFQESSLQAFLDATNLQPGIYNAEVTLFFEGKTKKQVMQIELREEKIVEEKSYLLYALLAIIIVDILWFISWAILRHRKKSESGTEYGYGGGAASGIDKKPRRIGAENIGFDKGIDRNN